jgi:hypothetical protein
MKKVFITGMAMVVATTLASNAMAAGAAAARPKAVAIEKMEEVTKDKAFGGKGHTAKDVTDKDTVINTIAEWLQMPGLATKLRTSIKADSAKANERLDSLALSYAAVKVGEKVAETDKADGTSLIEAGKAQAELISVASLKDSGKKSTTISADEHTAGIKAIEKLESENVKTLKDYSTAERDSWTAIKKEYSKTVATSQGSASEALVQSIMTVMKVDRTKALEIMKKLSDCV